MLVPDVVHAVIDDICGTGAAEQCADREAVDGARGNMEWTYLAFGIERPAGVVEIVETAFGIDGIVLEEIEETVGLRKQPAAMIGTGGPVAECRCHDTPPNSCTMP